jgi:hypothetical protein
MKQNTYTIGLYWSRKGHYTVRISNAGKYSNLKIWSTDHSMLANGVVAIACNYLSEYVLDPSFPLNSSIIKTFRDFLFGWLRTTGNAAKVTQAINIAIFHDVIIEAYTGQKKDVWDVISSIYGPYCKLNGNLYSDEFSIRRLKSEYGLANHLTHMKLDEFTSVSNFLNPNKNKWFNADQELSIKQIWRQSRNDLVSLHAGEVLRERDKFENANHGLSIVNTTLQLQTVNLQQVADLAIRERDMAEREKLMSERELTIVANAALAEAEKSKLEAEALRTILNDLNVKPTQAG